MCRATKSREAYEALNRAAEKMGLERTERVRTPEETSISRSIPEVNPSSGAEVERPPESYPKCRRQSHSHPNRYRRNCIDGCAPGFTPASQTLPTLSSCAFLPFLNGRSILLTSPTGSGKTLAGFPFRFRRVAAGNSNPAGSTPAYTCIYISPLRALAYDIEKNLRAPIAGMGLEKELRIHLRTGEYPPRLSGRNFATSLHNFWLPHRKR